MRVGIYGNRARAFAASLSWVHLRVRRCIRIPVARPRLQRLPKVWKRYARTRYTLKQKPLLDLFLLHAPWRRARYYLRREEDRVTNLVRALGMHYGIKHRHDYVRPIRAKRYHPIRALEIYTMFERQLGIFLQRVGWFSSPAQAAVFLKRGGAWVRRPLVGKPAGVESYEHILATRHTRIEPGDSIWFSKEFADHIRLRWRRGVRWVKESRQWSYNKANPGRVGFGAPRERRRRIGILFRYYKEYTKHQVSRRYDQFNYLYTEGFFINFNALCALYRPISFRVQNVYKANKIQGPGLDFWADTLNLKKFKE